MTLKLAPTSAEELDDSSCGSLERTSDATTSSRELLRLPLSRGRKEVYNDEGVLVAELPTNDLFANNTNIHIGGNSSGVNIGPQTHFHDPVTVIVHPPYIPQTHNGDVPGIDQLICDKEVHVIPPPVAPPVDKPRPGFLRRHFKAIMITLTAATLILATTLITLRLIASKKSKYSPPEPSTTEEPTTTTKKGPGIRHTFHRSDWGGRDVKDLDPIEVPIKFMIIKHTKTKACMDLTECFVAMQDLQHSDIAEHHLRDIRYNFVIGGDGNIYVGRGWDKRNEQMNNSIDVAFMGDYSVDIPSDFVAGAGNYLVVKGVVNGFLSYSDIKMVCHNQTEDTDSPGEYLYREIIKSEYYSKDILKNVGDLNESRVL